MYAETFMLRQAGQAKDPVLLSSSWKYDFIPEREVIVEEVGDVVTSSLVRSLES